MKSELDEYKQHLDEQVRHTQGATIAQIEDTLNEQAEALSRRISNMANDLRKASDTERRARIDSYARQAVRRISLHF
eukprot:SAG31_NODE_146_length_22601_cov_56.529192_24_plen_77_part_00